MGKDSFLLYDTYGEHIEFLTTEQAGVLIKAVYAYRQGKELPKMDGAVQMLFLIIRSQINKDNEKYERICERNAENISKRWGNKDDTKNTSGINGIPKIQNATKNTDNDNDNDNDIKEKDIYNISKKKIPLEQLEEQAFDEETSTNTTPLIANKKKFIPPTLDDVVSYARQRGREDIAISFFDFFSVGDWVDSNGTPVKNWKQKFITWEQHNTQRQERKPLYAPPKVY